MKNKSKTYLSLALLALSGSLYAACPSTSISQNTSLVKNNSQLSLQNGRLTLRGGNEVLLRQAMQLANDTGRKLTIIGRYSISKDIPTVLKRKVDIDARQATFKATTRLQGDLISFNTTGSSFECPGSPSFTWLGGRFEVWDHPTSQVIPGGQSKNLGDVKKGSQKTADALSLRGDGVKSGSRKRHLGHVDIRRIAVYGTERSSESYRYAGGDSGILMIAAKSAYIRNNKFYGIRDAAIYLSADNTGGTLGDNYRLIDNYAERVYDGLTIKRGADNIEFTDNKIVDAVVAISTKSNNSGSKWDANNVKVLNNEIIKSIRAISLERSNNVQINDNLITQLGANVGGASTAGANKFSNAYEGISLNGVGGTRTISNNTIRGTNASSRPVHALTYRKFDNKTTTKPNISTTEQNKWTGVDRVNGSKLVKGATY